MSLELPQTPVYVIQCGTETESEVIKYLQELIRKCRNPGNKLDIQFTRYKDDQKLNKARIIYMDVEKCKKQNAFVIILVSRMLFDVVWSTPQKGNLLKMISIMKNCLHIWIDVNEEDVKRYSTMMIRKDLSFGRLHISELTKGLSANPDAKLIMIKALLRTSSTRKNYRLNNYACDDEIEEMKDRFLEQESRNNDISGIQTYQDTAPIVWGSDSTKLLIRT